jgi:hypothetical protein
MEATSMTNIRDGGAHLDRWLTSFLQAMGCKTRLLRPAG